MRSSIFTMFSCGLFILAAVACSKQDDVSKEALVKDPERLREVLRACRDDPSRMAAAHCRAADEARRERFLQRNEGRDMPPPTMHEPETSAATPSSTTTPNP